jgi:hypothetical protein
MLNVIGIHVVAQKLVFFKNVFRSTLKLVKQFQKKAATTIILKIYTKTRLKPCLIVHQPKDRHENNASTISITILCCQILSTGGSMGPRYVLQLLLSKKSEIC